MKGIRKVVGVFLAASLVWSSTSVKAESTFENGNDIYGKGGIAINVEDGEVLYTKNGTKQFFPASTTKVLTALLLVENVKPGTVLTASQYAVNREASSSKFRLRKGEKMTREEALEALLVMSCNDVAAMIGEHISKSEAEFGKLMTERAKKLGATNSVFKNASGLPDPNHKTTPLDMAKIMKEVLNYQEITANMKKNTATLVTNQRTVNVKNNGKIAEIPEILYGKTGYTNAAGNTLVTVIKKGKHKIISVVMKSKKPYHYSDVRKMAQLGYNKLEGIKAPVSKNKEYVVTANSLNVREKPSAKSKKLGVLKKGTSITVRGTEGKWYKIEYKKGFGYVHKSYVKSK